MKNKINKSILLLLLICILTLVGCSKETPVDTNTENNANNNTPSAINDSEENSDLKDIKIDSGRYQGQIDNNSIEIKISGVPDSKATKVFFLDEDFKEEFNKLKLEEDQNIKFEYYENENNQKVITKIDVLDDTTIEIKTDSGRFQGEVDNNSIEIKISGIPDDKPARVFLLDDGFKDEFNELALDKDREILFEYYVDDNDQKIITRISIFGK